MATVMTAALSLTLAAPLALASVVVADAVTIGIDVAGTVGSRRRAISMMGTGAITDAITRAAVIANPIAIGIDVAGTVATIARTIVVANPIAIGIDVAPPGDGLRGHVRRHGSLPRGQVSHTKRESRNGKDDAQSRGRNRDHFLLH